MRRPARYDRLAALLRKGDQTAAEDGEGRLMAKTDPEFNLDHLDDRPDLKAMAEQLVEEIRAEEHEVTRAALEQALAILDDWRAALEAIENDVPLDEQKAFLDDLAASSRWRETVEALGAASEIECQHSDRVASRERIAVALGAAWAGEVALIAEALRIRRQLLVADTGPLPN